MAVTKYKASTEYRDPETGTIYLDGTGSRNRTTTSSPTGSAAATRSGTYGNTVVADSPSAATGPGSSTSDNVLYGTGAQSKSTRKTTSGSSGYSYDTFSYDPFKTSGQTDRYASELHELENNKPDEYSSKYESTIQGILDNILNRKSFSLDDDANYQQLYDNYKERYQTQADKAMRDTLASANAATGGYGSTYGQAATTMLRM